MRMHHTRLQTVACLAHIFPHYLLNNIVWKKVTEQKMCFDFLYNFYLKHFSLYEEMNKIWSKTYIGLYVKCLLFLSNFNETWIFSTDFL